MKGPLKSKSTLESVSSENFSFGNSQTREIPFPNLKESINFVEFEKENLFEIKGPLKICRLIGLHFYQKRTKEAPSIF